MITEAGADSFQYTDETTGVSFKISRDPARKRLLCYKVQDDGNLQQLFFATEFPSPELFFLLNRLAQEKWPQHVPVPLSATDPTMGGSFRLGSPETCAYCATMNR